MTGEPAPPEVVAGAELDDCTEFEPQAATEAATAATAVINRVAANNWCVLVFKVLSPVALALSR
ncbi:MAG: hypothetical protein JWR37_3142 [Mycobacterium sp.]|nr:hypothetical protein [Mycobacterium sp.]